MKKEPTDEDIMYFSECLKTLGDRQRMIPTIISYIFHNGLIEDFLRWVDGVEYGGNSEPDDDPNAEPFDIHEYTRKFKT